MSVWLANHNHSSSWFGVSSLRPNCSPSFNFIVEVANNCSPSFSFLVEVANIYVPKRGCQHCFCRITYWAPLGMDGDRVSENRPSLGSMYPENSCPAVCSREDCNKALLKGKKACLQDISISTIVWIHILSILCPNICLDLFLQFSSNSISWVIIHCGM